MGVKEVRGFIANPKASKKTQFYQIKQRFQLYDLKPTAENMNITDAIAIPLAYKKLAMSGNLHKSFRDVNSNVGQAVVSYKNFGKTLEELFESRSVFRSVGNGKHIVPKVSLQDMGLKKGLVKDFKSSHSARYASYDLSATHPGVVVFEIDENGTPLILFHHTFTLKKSNNKAKIGTPSYEIEVASNLLISLLTLYLHFEIQHVIFEYSDWHRAGKALAVDRIAINSLFFSYGVIMAGAYQLGLQVSGINATEAKSILTGKKTATKQDIEKIINPKFPFLKNEHTRDAAAVAIAYITKTKQ
jgi:Holliday junction resolvasome RuvABC endonuclease subunit